MYRNLYKRKVYVSQPVGIEVMVISSLLEEAFHDRIYRAAGPDIADDRVGMACLWRSCYLIERGRTQVMVNRPPLP